MRPSVNSLSLKNKLVAAREAFSRKGSTYYLTRNESCARSARGPGRRAAPRQRHATPRHAVPRGSVNEPERARGGGGRQLGSGPTNLFCPVSLYIRAARAAREDPEPSCRGWAETAYPTERYKPPYCIPLSSAKPERRHAISLNRIEPVDSPRLSRPLRLILLV